MNQTLSVEDANFAAVFATLAAFGGIERYLIDQLGFTAADITTLRANYLE